MNPFKGLLDLLNIGKKPDDAPRPGEPAENPVPVLKDILAALKTAPAPSAPRPPMPTPPEKIQPTPPPAPAPASTQENADGLGRIRADLDAIAKQNRPATSQQPPASQPPAPVSAVASSAPPAPAAAPPVVNVPPAPSAPAPNVNVSPPAVNVSTPAASQPPAAPQSQPADSSGMLPGFVQRLGELFSSFTGTLADLVGKMAGIPKDQATGPAQGQGPGQSGPPAAAGTPPAPTGAGPQPPPGGNPPPGNTGQGPPEQPKEPEGENKPQGFLDSIGGFTKLAGVVTLVTGVFGKTYRTVEKFVMGQMRANEELKNYSGQLAIAFAQLQIQELQQNMKTAQATSGSGSLLAAEMKNLKTEFQPLREMNAIFKNKLAANFVASTAAVTKIATDAAKLLGLLGLAEDIEKNTRDRSRDNREPGVEAAQNLASGRWTQFGINGPLPPIE